MEGKGGRAQSESPVGEEGVHAASIHKMHKRLMRALPRIVGVLIEQARDGSLPHTKLLFQLVGLERGGLASKEAGPQGKTLEQILMEEWANEP